jgi:NADPH:quinone reductase-like Zn-dependent oxidoreductase
MRAVTVDGFGAEPVPAERPMPVPGEGEVLVRMSAAGLNPFDWKVIDGILRDVVPHRFPLVVGVDGAGTVAALGPEASGFEPGDAVYGAFGRVAEGGGSYAEYAVTGVGEIAAAPKAIALSEAAAVPTSGVAALNLADAVGQVRTLLVVGATGGVGTFLVQLAAARGVHVIATARGSKGELMKALGAAEVVDHSDGGLAGGVAASHPDGVDAVVDLVSATAEIRAIARLVRPGGVLLSPTYAVPPDGLPDIRAANFSSASSPGRLTRLAEAIDADEVRVVIGETTTLAGAPSALRRSRAGTARGKTVIVI